MANSTTKILATLAVAASAILATTPSSVGAQANQFPDAGLGPYSVPASPVVSTRTEVLAAGVIGENEANDSFPNTEATVTAFAEIGDTMYVGGKFTQVQIAATGAVQNQAFLAAFNKFTGEWIDTFRPSINGNVWDLKAAPNGQLIVAGQFTSVNGVGNTAGTAMIDPITAVVDPVWRANTILTGSTQYPIVRTLDIDGDFLYLGGNFTRLTGSNGITKNVGRLARVNINTGNADGAFLPDIGGIVFDVDADGDRVFVAGNYLTVNGVFHIGQVTLQSSNGAILPGQKLFVRTSRDRVDRSYQQTVLAVGDDVWLGGSEHNRQVYNRSDFSLIRSWVSHPFGDAQALAHLNGIVYSGSHAGGTGNLSSQLYRDAVTWPGLDGFTDVQPINYMAAFDATAHEQLSWIPQIGTSNGEGSWELFADSTNCLWSGGDFDRGSFDGNTPRFVQGFAKFCAADTVPPEPPTNPTAVSTSQGINLAWTGSTDDRGGDVRYEILKNGSVFASFISIQTFRDPNGTATDRYFVRAMDYTGNRSATTQVFTAEGNDTTRPSTPQNLDGTVQGNGNVALSWTASTDNVGVTEYIVFRNGVEFARPAGTSVVATNAVDGPNYYQVRAVDAAGNESFKTPSTIVTIVGADTTKPTTPRNLTGTILGNGNIALNWTPSSDDVAVVDYLVLRNGVVIDTVTSANATVVSPPTGNSYFQVRARDAAGNESFKTPPILITIDSASDTANPTTPRNLAGTQNGADVSLTWTASTDNVSVFEYIVLRNGTEIGRSPTPNFTVVGATIGTNYYQVRAVDAAGNQGFKTSPLVFEVNSGADTSAPTTPGNLAGTFNADDDIVLTWTDSNDNVGVVAYIMYRNNVEFARIPGTSGSTTPSVGANYYQIRAVDAAGNESFKTPPLRVDA